MTRKEDRRREGSEKKKEYKQMRGDRSGKRKKGKEVEVKKKPSEKKSE